MGHGGFHRDRSRPGGQPVCAQDLAGACAGPRVAQPFTDPGSEQLRWSPDGRKAGVRVVSEDGRSQICILASPAAVSGWLCAAPKHRSPSWSGRRTVTRLPSLPAILTLRIMAAAGNSAVTRTCRHGASVALAVPVQREQAGRWTALPAFSSSPRTGQLRPRGHARAVRGGEPVAGHPTRGLWLSRRGGTASGTWTWPSICGWPPADGSSMPSRVMRRRPACSLPSWSPDGG